MTTFLRTTFASALLVFGALFAGGAQAADAPATDPWAPMQRFIGDWAGVASGQAGDGAASRSYGFALNKRFINETNTTRYPEQEKNKNGEVHEHWGMFSYDKARKTLMLRQFHVEGFVNTYRLAAAGDKPGVLVFESENFENFSNLWKARETYEFVSDNEFIETFELAPPGKPFEVYSRNHFKRVTK